MINNEAWKYIETCQEIRDHGGVNRLLRYLGTTLEECQRQVSKRIEYMKMECMPGLGPPEVIIIRLSHMRGASYEVTHLEILVDQSVNRSVHNQRI